jgi:hypothetical protein
MTYRQRPNGYPLPRCTVADVPYYRVNHAAMFFKSGWMEFQKDKSMDELIPYLDELIERDDDHEGLENTA